MDRLIASNSVPLAQADTAPTTGTPQYATDGNPATNVPATLWPAYAFNTIQDEIYNVIVSAGLTPNRNAWNQLLTAIQSLIKNAAQGISSTSAISTTGKLNGVNNPNLLFNGSGEFGASGWTLGPQFAQLTDTGTGAGTYFSHTTALAAYTNSSVSPAVAVAAAVAMTECVDVVNAATAGTLNVSFAAFNSSGTFISNLAAQTIPNGSGLTRYTLTGTTPAGTAYVQMYVNFTGVTAVSGGVLWRRVKIEQGNVPSLYSQEASIAATGQAYKSLSASVASNALTVSLNAPTPMSFRNPTLSNGAPVVGSIASNLTLTVPSGATLGSISGSSSRLVWLVAYNGGSPALCVVNLAGGVNLDETTLISATAISSGATSANTIYSSSAITNSPFRVVGFTDIAETTAGTWATGPTTVQGAGGQALSALSSIGYGQTWQSFTSGTRPLATTFYNTTGKPIQVCAAGQSSNTNAYIQLVVNGVPIIGSTAATALTICTVTAIVPPGGSYLANMPVGGATWSAWTELR